MIETKLNNLEINELTEEQYNSAKESGNLSSNAFYMTPSAENVSDVLPVIKGGTGATMAADARTNLGFEYGSETPTHIPETGDGAIYFKIDNDNNDILPIEEGGTGAVTGYDALRNLGAVDYVIEQGTSGNWTYRKWNSGMAECWGDIQGPSVNVSNSWGSIYTYDHAIAPANYPFAFIERPWTQMTPYTDSGNYWLFTGYYGTTTQTPSVSVARPTVNKVAPRVHFYSKGRWK